MDIKLKDFQGPLDLLLHLVSKYQMDIYEVPIVEVIEQYLAYLATLQAMRLEVAGEYMLMASQLMLIKSRRLLPKIVETVQEEDDPEQTLLLQLEEYRKFKLLSQEMASQHDQRALHFSKPKQEIISEEVSLKQDKTTLDLYLAFAKIMASCQEAIKYSHTTIEREDYRIEDMMERLEHRIRTQSRLSLDQVFEETSSKQEMISLFLACLELIKIQTVQVEQAENFGTIYLDYVKKPA